MVMHLRCRCVSWPVQNSADINNVQFSLSNLILSDNACCLRLKGSILRDFFIHNLERHKFNVNFVLFFWQILDPIASVSPLVQRIVVRYVAIGFSVVGYEEAWRKKHR